MKEVTYKLKSVTPMLMHNINSMSLEKPSAVSHGEWEKSPEKFKSNMYLQGNKLVIPARVIKAVLTDGAKRVGIKQKGKRSTYAELVGSMLFVTEGLILDQAPTDAVEEKAYVTVSNSKVLRIWPKLEKWSGAVKIIIADEKVFQPSVLDEIFNFSGLFVGIGDYRPEFGRFEVKKV